MGSIVKLYSSKDIVDLKGDYNEKLVRYHKGINYLSENRDKIDQYLPLLNDIMKDLSKLIEEIKKSGYNMTQDEVLNGF